MPLKGASHTDSELAAYFVTLSVIWRQDELLNRRPRSRLNLSHDSPESGCPVAV